MPLGSQTDLGHDYWSDAPSAVPGFTNKQLADALAASQAANPNSAGLGPGVNHTEAQPQSAPSTQPAVDWGSYLGMFGLPADVIKELDAIFQRSAGDPEAAAAIAIAYVRGTDWYKVTFPGIQEAIAKGVIRNETEYRAHMNAFNQLYRQYANRDISLSEYADLLREGVSVDVVGKRFQGSALEQEFGNDWQYLSGAFSEGRLSAEESQAYGRQQAGLDSALGLRVQRKLQMAQDRIRSVFSGQLATGKLASLSQSGELPPDVGR